MILQQVGTATGDCLVLVVETLAFRKAIKTTIHMNIVNISTKNDYQVVIDSIMGKIVALKQICNLVNDI